MKITAFLLFFACLSASAASHAQTVSLSENHIAIQKLLDKISKQSGFVFWYESKLLKHATIERFQIQNGTIIQVLDLLVKYQPFTYNMVDNTIVINEKQGDATKLLTPIKISGKVTDEKGIPLAGVTVVIKGTQIGSISDKNGLFYIAAQPKDVLMFSFIGYKTQEVLFSGQADLSISLQPDQSQLKDIIVIGYGNKSRADVTTAISKIKGTELTRYSGSNFAQQMTGKAAGVVVNDASGQPGTDPQVVIRGIGTLTAGRAPLIVVDGFPLSEGSSFNSINPQDIESIDILKDAASGAIYGSRAANGVILITTKKGGKNKLNVSLDVYSGIQQRHDNLRYVNAHDAAVYFTEARDNGYVSKDPVNRSASDDRATRISKGASLRELRLNYLQPYLSNIPGLPNTNWLDEVFKTAPLRSYNLSISGSTEKTNFYISGNFFNQDGIVINNGLKRYSGEIKLDTKLSNTMTFGISLNPSFSKARVFSNNSNNSSDVVSDITINYPFFPAYNADGTIAVSQQLKGNGPEDGALAESPVALAKLIKNNRNDFRTFGNSYLIFEPLSGLKFKTLLGTDVRSNFYDYYNPSTVGGYRAPAPKPATAIETDGNSVNYITENTVNYARRLGNHDLDFLAGYTYQSESGVQTSITGSSIPDDNISNIAGASAFTASTDRYTWSQISYLARLQYGYKNTYLLSATIRRDGSSRFGDNKKWGNFPSITAGYILSKEDFFPKNDVLTFAKIRASWGSAGNNQIGSYSAKALIGSGSANGSNDYNFNYVFGNTLNPGFAATTTPNKNLTWETKNSVDAGVDLNFFHVVNLVADYYNSVTKNLLLNVPIPEQSGFVSSIQNIGRVQNRGFEFELNASEIKTGKFTLGFNANLATNRNKVLALAPGQTQIIQGAASNFVTKVGYPVAEIYGYNVIGVYKGPDQIANTPHLGGTLVGDYIVEDRDHNGIIDARDQKPLGTFNPKFSYGFGANVGFAGFELSLSFSGVYGRKIYDYGLATLDDSGEGFSMPSQYYFNNRYDPVANPNGFLAAPNLGNLSSARRLSRASAIFCYDGSYLRLRNLQLAYNLPEKITQAVFMNHVRVYATANNLFTWTKYRGYNPDATTGNVLTDGLANTNYPVARSFIFGANISF